MSQRALVRADSAAQGKLRNQGGNGFLSPSRCCFLLQRAQEADTDPVAGVDTGYSTKCPLKLLLFWTGKAGRGAWSPCDPVRHH